MPELKLEDVIRGIENDMLAKCRWVCLSEDEAKLIISEIRKRDNALRIATLRLEYLLKMSGFDEDISLNEIRRILRGEK